MTAVTGENDGNYIEMTDGVRQRAASEYLGALSGHSLLDSLSDLNFLQGSNVTQEKFEVGTLLTGQPVEAAGGLESILGLTAQQAGRVKLDGIKAIESEF